MQTQPKSRRALRLTATLAAALALQLPLSGCFGRFALVKKVYGFNETIGDKWLRSLLMFGLVVIPVYQVAAFFDYVVLNVIEFWTGSNPAAASLAPGETLEKSTVASDGTKLRMVIGEQGQTLTLIVEKPGDEPQTTVLRKTGSGAEARDAKGALLAALAVTEEGGAVISDGAGAVKAQRSAQEVAQLAASARLGGEALAQALLVQRSLRVAAAR